MREVVAGMRETIRARQASAPDPVNADAALSLFGQIPLVWDGVEHRVGKIGYLAGLQLQKRILQFKRIAAVETADESTLDTHTTLVEEIIDQFWGFLDPKPAVNPFLELAPLEVGAIANFFLTCQQIQNQPSRQAVILPSPSTISMRSASS